MIYIFQEYSMIVLMIVNCMWKLKMACENWKSKLLGIPIKISPSPIKKMFCLLLIKAL